MDLYRRLVQLATDPKNNRWITPLLYLVDGALCTLVVWKIPYTEIDWRAYMQQIETYLTGQLDYVKLHGDTGPLVYPAGHVHIYRLLYAVTAQGRDIVLAQFIFIGIYLAALAVTMQCYRSAGAPPYLFPLLILSKRLHSIFLLRLFNDGIAVLFLFAAIHCFQRRRWTAGSLAYSFGLSVKMSLLLALPAVGVVLWQGMGRDRALKQAIIMGQLQILLGFQFLLVAPKSYISRAFEFSRQFLFKWTVNWRFVGEEAFLSRSFSAGLLVAHAGLLLSFVAIRWLRPSQLTIPAAIQRLIAPSDKATESTIAQRTTPRFILTTILASMIVGCLCARSLHYQFYAYIAWSTPFLLWQSKLHPILIYAVWALQELAWNVYPSTNISSMVVVSCLAVTTVCGLMGGESRIDDDKKE